MPIFIVLVAVFMAGVAYSFYPHWSAYLVIPFIVFLLWVANRVRIEDRKRERSTRPAYSHPKLDKGPARTLLHSDPRLGQDSSGIF